MVIKVFGSDCKNCTDLFSVMENVVEKLGIDVDLQKITELEKILESGVISTPAMMIDEKLMFAGRVPVQGELEKMIKRAS